MRKTTVEDRRTAKELLVDGCDPDGNPYPSYEAYAKSLKGWQPQRWQR